MLYCICDASKPAEYLTCGNLVSENRFVHLHRTLDFFVLILVQEGTLHICQDGRAYDISPGEFFVLFPGSTHYGYKPTRGYLWDMPRINGIEAAEKIQGIVGSLVPILFVIDTNDKSVIARCRKAGAAGYIVRPYKPTYVKAEIKRILTGQQVTH